MNLTAKIILLVGCCGAIACSNATNENKSTPENLSPRSISNANTLGSGMTENEFSRAIRQEGYRAGPIMYFPDSAGGAISVYLSSKDQNQCLAVQWVDYNQSKFAARLAQFKKSDMRLDIGNNLALKPDQQKQVRFDYIRGLLENKPLAVYRDPVSFYKHDGLEAKARVKHKNKIYEFSTGILGLPIAPLKNRYYFPQNKNWCQIIEGTSGGNTYGVIDIIYVTPSKPRFYFASPRYSDDYKIARGKQGEILIKVASNDGKRIKIVIDSKGVSCKTKNYITEFPADETAKVMANN